MRLYTQPLLCVHHVDPQQAVKFEEDAGRYWDLFYKRNGDKFFKDRHYFDKEWPQLLQGSLTVLEVGCGAGNSVFPLLELNPQLRVFACDFSPRAVELVQAHPAYAAATGRVSAFVCDITQADGPGCLAGQLPAGCVDYCSMVFVLSAVAPQKMRQALRNVAAVLKRGTGRVLFRDYAEGDMAQERLQDSKGVRQIRGNFYARGDGTCCYYFGQDELLALFASEGFVCESSIIHAPTVENRKTGVKMDRRWVQAVFRFDPDAQLLQAPAAEQQGWQPHQPQHLQQQQQQGSQAQEGPQQQQSQPTQQQGHANAAAWQSSGVCSITCAGRPWQLPCSLGACQPGGSSSSSSGSSSCSGGSCCACLAEALVSHVLNGQVQLLGKVVLLCPPWLSVGLHNHHQQQQAQQKNPQPPPPQQQRQQQQRQQQRQLFSCHALPQQGVEACGVCCCGWHGGPAATAAAAEQQGAAAALLALVAVWLGAKRVYVCLPDTSEEQRQQQVALEEPSCEAASEAVHGGSSSSSNAIHLAAFAAVLALNESSVVVERIRPRVWGPDSTRHAALLQRELLEMQGGCSSSSGLVVAAHQAAAAAAGDTPLQQRLPTSDCQSHQGAQQLLDALFGVDGLSGCQLLLVRNAPREHDL